MSFKFRLIHNYLPVKIKLDAKGIDIHYLLYSLCDNRVESVEHSSNVMLQSQFGDKERLSQVPLSIFGMMCGSDLNVLACHFQVFIVILIFGGEVHS